MISDVFRDFIDSHKTGLGIIELPTSIGKTYSTFECIAKYTEEWAEYKKSHRDNGNFRQIILVTTLKKNLTGLDAAYKRHGRQDYYESEVLFLDNLKEILKSNFELLSGKDKTVPGYIINLPVFQDLKSKVDFILKGEKYQLPTELQQKLSSDANKVYLELRSQIVAAYKSKNKVTNKITLTTVAENQGFEWVFRLYPDLRIPTAKVLLMSFKKLMDGRVYEKPSCAFTSKQFLHEKIIFVDEFDSGLHLGVSYF